MNILITGYKGFIGKNIWNSLCSDHCLLGIDIDDPIPSLKDIDLVIHLGAISSTTETNISKLLKYNLNYSILLYEKCIKYKIPFQWASSASVYGINSGFKETSIPSPQNHYALSKFMFEEYLLKRNGTRWQAFRYFNVYGDLEENKGIQASPYTQFKNQALSTGTIKIFEGSENFKRDFIPVSKIVDIHKHFFNVNYSGIWNAGSGSAISFLDIAKTIARKYNAKIEFIPFPEKLKNHYQKYTKADLTKLSMYMEI